MKKAIITMLLIILSTWLLTPTLAESNSISKTIQSNPKPPTLSTIQSMNTGLEFATIQEAINAANPGDTIHVSQGTYHEHITLNKTLSLVGEDKTTTIIDGDGTGTLINITVDGVNISGFTVQNGEIGIDLNSNNNTITSNILTSNGKQETDLQTNLEIYPQPPENPIWRTMYDLMNGAYTEYLDITTEIPVIEVKVIGHDDVAQLFLGLFHDRNMDGTAQLNEYAGFGSRDKVTNVVIPNLAKGRYIIKVRGWDVVGNPGHFDRQITKSTGGGISGRHSADNVVSRNLITGNYVGVNLQSCSNVTFSENNATNNLGAIILGDSENSTITTNGASNNNQTIALRNVANVTVINNALSFNNVGIHVWNSSAVNVSQNNLYTHEVWAVGLISTTDSTVANNEISVVNGLDGIRLMFSSRNTVAENNMSYCEHSGILLWYENNDDTAIGNHISHSGSQGWGDGHGVEIILSTNNTFTQNVMELNSRNQGILVLESTDTTVTENLVRMNRKGIQLRSSSGNRVYHNTLIDNWETQGIDDTGTNSWDDGYPSGGNYWTDYTGTDSCGGPSQNVPGPDGIGDTHQPIHCYYQPLDYDNYPLMTPWTSAASEQEITITRGGQTHTIQTYSTATISDLAAGQNLLHFEVSGFTGATAHVSAVVPVGMNKTELKIFLNGSKLNPPPYPVIAANGTHYFIYFTVTFASTYMIDLFFDPVPATINVDPDTLNLESRGNYITSYIELPENYGPNDIVISTLTLNNTVHVDVLSPTEIRDFDRDGTQELMIKFSRAETISFILANVDFSRLLDERLMEITLSVTGELHDGMKFEGSDTIHVILSLPRSGRIIEME